MFCVLDMKGIIMKVFVLLAHKLQKYKKKHILFSGNVIIEKKNLKGQCPNYVHA